LKSEYPHRGSKLFRFDQKDFERGTKTICAAISVKTGGVVAARPVQMKIEVSFLLPSVAEVSRDTELAKQIA